MIGAGNLVCFACTHKRKPLPPAHFRRRCAFDVTAALLRAA
jgi:hypothetical protein